MNVFRLLLTMTLVTGLAGCSAGPKSGKGFTLPEGDADQGQAVFTQLHCYLSCNRTTNSWNSSRQCTGRTMVTERHVVELAIHAGHWPAL